MKKLVTILLSVTLLLTMTACANQNNGKSTSQNTEQAVDATQKTEALIQAESTSESETEADASNVLIAYFSLPDNEDDSTVEINGETLGNTQYMASVIQKQTGGDVFRIEAETPYTTDHEALVDLASAEKADNARPAIASKIENIDQYDTIFIGYPIWWSDMPMIMYTFFDTYDFTGKTIIPFNTHGGSGFAGTPETIAKLEQAATMRDGLTISRDDIQDGEQEIVDWLNEMGYEKEN